MLIRELMEAKDYFERGNAILEKSGCVLAEDFQSDINQLRKEIVSLQLKVVS